MVDTVWRRILQGAEARRFRETLGVLVGMVRDDDEGMWRFNAAFVTIVSFATTAA